MLFRLSHALCYTYEAPVLLAPQLLHLHPRPGLHLHVSSYALQISPQPSQVVLKLDAEGNPCHLLWFAGTPTDRLSIQMQATVENTLGNVFDFVIYPFENQQLPVTYTPEEQHLLQLYLKDSLPAEVHSFAARQAAEANGQTLPFLTGLNQTIRRSFHYEIREEGPARLPAETLALRSGSCRDYAVLYAACCQAQGLAARFVSGYYHGSPDEPQYLHAWAEVYLPGAGWRGFDPTQNLVAGLHHLPLAASALPERVSPLTGVYRGEAASRLQAMVQVNRL